MKKISNKMKILALILAVIIITGVTVALTIGFEFDLRFERSNSIDIYLEKQFEISDIKQITDETMSGKNVIIQKVEVFEDSVKITAENISEEEKNNTITKINEKYQTEILAEDISIDTLPHVRARDILMPYVVPFVIASVIALAYMIIHYRKVGIVKVITQIVCILMISQVVLFSIIAILQIPLGTITIPLVITVYVAGLIYITNKLQKQLKETKEVENK